MSYNIPMTLAQNKKAKFEWQTFETIEAGVSLLGGEVRSVRNKNASIDDAYVKLIKGEDVNYRSLKYIHDKVYDDIFVIYFTKREDATVLNLKYGKRTEIR